MKLHSICYGHIAAYLIAALLLFSGTLHSQIPRDLPVPYNAPFKNLIRTWDATAPEQSPTALVTRSLKDVKQTTAYFDGLGRPLQTVVKQGSMVTGGSPTDLISAVTYDEYGRERYKYLPFAATNNDGLFKLDPFQQQAQFYNTRLTGQTDEFNTGGTARNWAYGQTNFEASQLNRVQEVFVAGTSWVGTAWKTNESDHHSVKTKFYVNTATDDVKQWTVTEAQSLVPPGAPPDLPPLSQPTHGDYVATNSITLAPGFLAPDVAGTTFSATILGNTCSVPGIYADGQLYKIITIDEHGKQVIEFKDKEGKLILKKVQLTAAADNGSGSGYTGWLCTYYVYDDLDNLRLVIQPKGVELLADHSWDITWSSNVVLNEQCFRYEYDARNRMIRKKVPGAGEVWMVYDQWDRLVLTQDANLRPSNKWVFTKYDALNRPIMTGFYTNASYTSQAAMQGYVSTQNMGRFETYTPSVIERYTFNNSFPVNTLANLLVMTFYDDYAWTGWHGPNWDARNSNHDSYLMPVNGTFPYPEAVTQSSNTRGLKTGECQLNFENGPISSFIYDVKGRVIQTQTLNIAGGRDITTTQYSFSGQPLVTINYHDKQGANPQTHTVVTKMDYDDLGRLLTTKKSVNSVINSQTLGKPEQVIASNEYDALGQLKKKTLGPGKGPGGLPVETLEYDYNVRGWPLGMNRSYLETPSKDNHWFGYELAYDKISNNKGYYTWFWNAQFNGNITGALWKSKGDGMARKYDFTYDAANRLTGADFNQQNGQGWDRSAGLDFSVSNLSYDANGNILRMDQKGWKPGGSTTIDNLFYAYHNDGNSNRLKNVWDKANDPQTKLGDFRSSSAYMTFLGSKNENATDYDYDLNGNLKKDLNKDIDDATADGIEYNHLNLPVRIRVKNKGSIEYVYDNSGVKFKKIVHETGKPDKTTLYLGEFTYENDVLQFVGHEEGRLRLSKQIINGTPAEQFQYDYFLKDHLGNVRMLLTEQTETANYLASMETAYRTTEDKLFYNIPQTSYEKSQVPGGYPADPTTDPNEYVSRTNGSDNKIGPALVLKVMSGDKVDIGVKSFYKSGGTTNSGGDPLANLLSSLATGIVGVAGDSKGALSALSNTSTSPLLGAVNSFRSDKNPNQTGKPKAYLNWILLDEQLNYVAASSNADPVKGADAIQPLTSGGPVTMTKNGFLYIYVSNETQNWDVFFDNLKVDHVTGPITEETHYYPFGLTMAGISSKALKPGYTENKKKFVGQDFENDLGCDMYQFRFRTHDPQIGRFLQVDPLSHEYLHNTPYAYAENKVINGIDLEGLEWFSFLFSSGGSSAATTATEAAIRVVGETGAKVAEASAETGSKSNRFTPEQLQRFKEGREVEAEQLAKHGLEKNNKPIKEIDPKTGEEGTTVPDAFKNGGESTSEVKNVKSQSMDKQLRLQNEFSKKGGFKPELIINQGAKISKAVKDAFDIKYYQGNGVKIDNVNTGLPVNKSALPEKKGPTIGPVPQPRSVPLALYYELS